MKKLKLPHYQFLFLVFSLILFIRCSGDYSHIKNVYIAEKMYFKAAKLRQNVLVNPGIVRPQQYQNVEQSFRNIINQFNDKKDISEIRQIVQQSWLQIAELLLLQEDFDNAIEIYHEIISKSPEDKELRATAQYSIGTCYEKLNQFENAIEAYQKVVHNYEPVLSDTLLPNINILQTPIYIARLYRRQDKQYLAVQQYELARAYYENVIQKWQNTPIALVAENQIAMTYGDQGRWQKATEILNQIIYKYSDNSELFNIMYALGNIYRVQLNDSYNAISIYQRILNKFPKRMELGKVFLAWGEILLAQQNYHDARSKYQTVLKRYSHDKTSSIQAQLGIARAYEFENNWQKALNEYQWIVDNYPTSLQAVDIPLYIADYYRKHQLEKLAFDAYEDAIRKYLQSVELYQNTVLAVVAQDYLATCYIRLEDWQNATEALQLLTTMSLPIPKKINTFMLLANIYEQKLTNEQKAIDTYTELLHQFPDIPAVNDVRVRIKKLEGELANYQRFNAPPAAPTLIKTNKIADGVVEVQWSPSWENDFYSYKLLRSETSGMAASSQVVAELFDSKRVSFQDKNLDDKKAYYYKLYVYDKGGLSAESAEVKVDLHEKTHVAAVNLQAQPLNWSTVLLTWDQSSISKFDSYKIYCSRSPNVSTSSELVKSIYNPGETQFKHQDLKESTAYFYKVYVFNSQGDNKASNEAKVVTTKNSPPDAVVLQQPQSIDNATIKLSWSKNTDDDFSMYRIYRSDRANITIDRAPIWMSSNHSVNLYKDTGLRPGKTYYYKIVVFDKGGLTSESNEVEIKL